MQMIRIRMLVQRKKCKEPVIKSHSHVITMISQSAQKDRGYTPTSCCGGFRGGSGGSLEPPSGTKLFQFDGEIYEKSG